MNMVGTSSTAKPEKKTEAAQSAAFFALIFIIDLQLNKLLHPQHQAGSCDASRYDYHSDDHNGLLDSLACHVGGFGLIAP
jgi:hypothetical protein